MPLLKKPSNKLLPTTSDLIISYAISPPCMLFSRGNRPMDIFEEEVHLQRSKLTQPGQRSDWPFARFFNIYNNTADESSKRVP